MTTPNRIDPETPERVTPQMRLQILAAEHSSLVATRSLVWNEVFARTGMYLTGLSGAIVALALAGQGTGFGQPFNQFALVILPVVLFLGITTFVRLGASNYHDAQVVIGMNRIRAAYLSIAPDLAPYFVMSAHDDIEGVGITMGFPRQHPISHLLSATVTVVTVVNSVIVGAIVGLTFGWSGVDRGVGLSAAVVGAIAAFAVHATYGRVAVRRAQAGAVPRFPSPNRPS